MIFFFAYTPDENGNLINITQTKEFQEKLKEELQKIIKKPWKQLTQSYSS